MPSKLHPAICGTDNRLLPPLLTRHLDKVSDVSVTERALLHALRRLGTITAPDTPLVLVTPATSTTVKHCPCRAIVFQLFAP